MVIHPLVIVSKQGSISEDLRHLKLRLVHLPFVYFMKSVPQKNRVNSEPSHLKFLGREPIDDFYQWYPSQKKSEDESNKYILLDLQVDMNIGWRQTIYVRQDSRIKLTFFHQN